MTQPLGVRRSAGVLLFTLLIAIPVRIADALDRAPGQGSVLVIRVIDAASRRPLPNAEVRSVDDGRVQLTNAMGEARLAWPPSRTLRLRVRQIGFRFAERTMRAGEGIAADSAVFALERVPIVLPELRATAAQPCEVNEDPEVARLSLAALEQLQLGARHYQQFQESYPFDVHLERRTAVLRSDTTTGRLSVRDEWTHSGKFEERYERGRVLNRYRLGWDAKLLFIVALADTTFWESHCLTVRGVEQRDDRRLIRLDFAPVPGLASPDWSGTAWLDSASNVLRRLDFRMTGIEGRDDPARLEGYTTFVERSAFITVPDSTVGFWWTRRPAPEGDWGAPNTIQLLRVKEVRYRKETPPPP